MLQTATLPDLLRLEALGGNRYKGRHEHEAGTGRDVVFGGQIFAQMIMASAIACGGDKEVKSIHGIFARPGTYTQPMIYEVESMHSGRTFASDTVTARQGDRLMSRAMVLLNADEPDLFRHQTVTMPQVPGPDDPRGRRDLRVFPGADGIVCYGVDTRKADAPKAPPELFVWTRYPKSFDSPIVNQAILSWATDGYLIGTAMRPHVGFREGEAHLTFSTGPVSHTIDFHERFDVSQWLLMAMESIWAGRGRTYGRCNVFTQEGTLVATYTQDNMIRAFAAGQKADSKRVM